MNHENVLPEAVVKQVEAADNLFKELYAEEPEGKEPETKEPEAKEPDPAPEKKPEEDSFEHKFSVLKGKYDKEVPRLHRQLRDSENDKKRMADRLSQLEAEVRRLNEVPPKAPEPPLSQQEIDEFGPDLIDIIRRVAKAETGVVLDEQLKPVKESLKQKNETVAKDDTDVSESDRRQMLTDLADAIPDWEKQNEDPKFLDWLDLEDPYTGKARTELLADAYMKADAPRLIAIFKGFQKENAVVTPDDEPSDETPAEEEKSEQPLEDLVAPGTPKTGSAGAQNESGKRIWTQKDITEFYAYKNEFIKKTPEKELPEKVILLEKDLFNAQAEGRIK